MLPTLAGFSNRSINRGATLTSTLRVVTYNISGAIGANRRFYSRSGSSQTRERVAIGRRFIGSLAKAMGELDVDVIALQEVDRAYGGGGESGADIFDQAKVLATSLGMEHRFEPAFDYHILNRINVTTGLATLTRRTLQSSHVIHFPSTHLSWRNRLKASLIGKKIALETTVSLGGRPFRIVNAHLTHNHDQRKVFELEILLAHCEAAAPCLLVGDLNTTPSSSRSPAMIEADHFLTDACMAVLERYQRRGMQCDDRLGTFTASPSALAQILNYPAPPSSEPTLKLDYMFLFSDHQRYTLGRETVLDLEGSNHLAITSDIEYHG